MATKKKQKKKRLGMGLSSMLAEPVPVDAATPADTASPAAAVGDEPGTVESAAGGTAASSAVVQRMAGTGAVTGSDAGAAVDGAVLVQVPVGEISPSRHQPRQHIDQKALAELAASIKVSGLMQPVLVRPKAAGGSTHELIAGERRWRAAQAAGLTSVPCIVRAVSERDAAELGIVENLQRQDLDAIETADAFRRLQDEFGHTHQEIGDRVGWSRAAVTNHIRLCDLDAATRELVQSGDLSGGHARALLAIADVEARVALATKAIEEGWSVRAMERAVRDQAALPSRDTADSAAKPTSRRAHLDDLEKQLSDHLATRVRITANKTGYKGKLQIEFYDLDQFDGLLQRLGFKLH